MGVAAASQRAATIGHYQTMRQLGAGAMGEVFLAHDDELGREIAIKLLPPHLAESPEHLFRLRHEARSASALNHPNIVTIYEIGHDDEGRAFMAMEYVDGQTLREAMHGGPMPVKKALQVITQIADGLAAAHKRGLVHRDLKPENIMITSDGVVKILDFGLAKSFELAAAAATDQTANFSEPGMVVGTPAYMSPEQARAGRVDYRSDQFALGAILYEMLSGRHAFEGESPVETLLMIVRDEPTPLSAVAPHVLPPVRWIVDRCLAKDPEDRYMATRDLARDLQTLRDHFSEAQIAPLRDEAANFAQRAKRFWPVAAMLALALLIGGATAWTIRTPAPRAIVSERYLTYSGHDFSPAVSPDRKLIAFSSDRDGTSRIWLKEVAGGGEVPLTAGPDDFPRFSPDGTSILYTHAEPEKPPVLYRVPVVGGEARRLVERATSGDFSPDGRQLAFTRNNVPDDPAQQQTVSLFVAAADGSNPRELARVDLNTLSHPRWSPDGKRIAALGATGRVVEAVYVFDAHDGTTKILSGPSKASEVSTVVWTPDSKAVLYVRAESVEAVVGSPAHVIRHDVDLDRAEAIAWVSHNGTHLDRLGDGRLILDSRSPSANLRESGAAASRWITRGNSSDRQPVYAPDGKTLLFSSNRSGNLDLWTIAAEGGAVRRITEDAAEDWDPAFTADGKRIVWSSGRSGNLEIWMANTDGSDARQISRDGQDAENPSATADGWIIYNSFHGSVDKQGVWKIREDGSRATRLVAGRTSLPEVSPDGKYVAYINNGRSVKQAVRVVRVADGKDMGFSVPIRATRHTGAILGRMRWTPDGKAIAYLGQDDAGVNGVFVQDFVPDVDTAKSRRALGGFDRERATESFGISPDGKTLAIAGWEQLFSILSIDGVRES